MVCGRYLDSIHGVYQPTNMTVYHLVFLKLEHPPSKDFESPNVVRVVPYPQSSTNILAKPFDITYITFHITSFIGG
jgi:hypothetical protein